MVRFEGRLSDECVLYRQMSGERIMLIVYPIVLLVLTPIGVILSCIGVDGEASRDFWISAGALILITICIFISYKLTRKPRVKINIVLTIDKGMLEYIGGPRYIVTMPVSRIKKVLCIGERYYIVSKRRDVSTSFMAEKSLLKEGTIEEFEALFADKIVRKELKGNNSNEEK